MKKTLSNLILESFNEDKPKVVDLSSTAQEELFDNKVITLYRCSECDYVFGDSEMSSAEVDMEDYYGVGSDFPDHHIQSLQACPKCKSVDLESLGEFSLDDFEDGWKLEESYRDTEGNLGDGTSYNLDYFNKMKHELSSEFPDIDISISQDIDTQPNSRRAIFKRNNKKILELPFEVLDIDKVRNKLKSLNEVSIFQRVAGPKRKQVSEYSKDITSKLFPLLKEFGLEMYSNPMSTQPGKIVYAGNLDGRQVQLAFFSSYEDNEDVGEGEDTLYVKVSYNGKLQDAGYIKLDTDEDADKAFSQITKALEDLGYVTQADKEAQEQEAKNKEEQEEKAKDEEYVKNENLELPPKDLLETSEKQSNQEDIEKTSQMLVETLQDFEIEAEVVDVHVGPAVTQFELKLEAGTKLSTVTSLSKEISLALSAKNVRIEAPIPGKSTIGIEIPNQQVGVVNLADILNNTEPKGLSIALGVDTNGTPHQADIIKMQHLLIGGSTGSGKSAFINSMISSLLMNYKPNEVKLILIDPKRVELNQFSGVPHLLMPIVNDPQKAADTLKQLVQEMDKRYQMMSEAGVKNITGYNEKARASGARPMYYIVCVVDELADLMQVAGKEVEGSIQRITQLARAAGIHLVVATQRPSVDVVTGTIKSNLPSRISFATASGTDSRTILDQTGAEKLLGKGDMLYKPIGASNATRLQGAFTSDEEVEKIVNYYKGEM